MELPRPSDGGFTGHAGPQGQIIRGSSAVNAQMFLRGPRDDYDAWASLGNDQWSYNRLLPYFCMNEADPDFQNDYHGNDGPIRIRRFKGLELNPTIAHSTRPAGPPATQTAQITIIPTPQASGL